MAQPSCSNEDYLYPPPSDTIEKLLALVVEKKGEDTGTSMRQKELYAFSNHIIIRDGYMVMPKIHWNDYEPGDWFCCTRDLTEDLHGYVREKELMDLHKFSDSRAVKKTYDLPDTRFHNGNVQIIRPFVLCPDFIRHRKLIHCDSTHWKLYALHFNQMFVSSHTISKYKLKIESNVVYTGIFEFRGKDNGAVNFAPKSRIRDVTGHTLERDAMWELVQLTNDKHVPLAQHKVMQDDLEDLRKFAKRTHETRERIGAFAPWKQPKEVETPPVYVKPKHAPIIPSRPRSHPDSKINELMTDLHKATLLRAAAKTKEFFAAKRAGNSESSVTNTVTEIDSAEALTATIQFENRCEIEAHRMRMIHQTTISDSSGADVLSWFDEESGKYSFSRDFLDFAFNKRYHDQLEKYPASEEPAPPSPEPQSSSPGPELDITPELDTMRISPPAPERVCQFSISEMSTFLPEAPSSMPIASSTPHTSPTALRRRLSGVCIQNGTIREENPYDDTQEMFTFTEYKDNNANIATRQFTDRQ